MRFETKQWRRAALLTFAGMASLMLAASMPAHADVDFYVGIEGGYSDIELKELEDSESYGAYAGITFLKVVGFELGYAGLGDFASTIGGGRSSVEVDSVMQASIAFHGPLLVFETPRIHARYGYYQADVTPNIPNGRATATEASDFTYALGVSYPVLKPLSLSLNYQFFNEVEGQSIQTYSAGLRLDF